MRKILFALVAVVFGVVLAGPVMAQGAPAQLDSGDWHPSRLRVFNQMGHLIAIAEPVVPRTYQPVLVLEATP